MITSICRDVETAGVPDPRQMSQVRPNTLEAVLRKWAKCTESLGQPKYQFFITQDWVLVLNSRAIFDRAVDWREAPPADSCALRIFGVPHSHWLISAPHLPMKLPRKDWAPSY